MRKYLAAILALALLTMVLPSCSGGIAPQGQSGSTGDFRLLVSDEPNDITDFTSVNVTISKVGVLSADSDNWTEINLVAPLIVNLVDLQGDNATEVWTGKIVAGNYTKVFIYVDNVTGVLRDSPSDNATVKLPGDKLQISKPFMVAADGSVSFVFDITIIKAGQSGKYILKPQIGASGAAQPFNDVTPAAPKHEKDTVPKGQGKNR